ncbi:class I glutamine amidotransferase-like protein [Macrophomina phaseolina]|uniref:Class I glutamine amidotransferase-like protein n=1 Tax=Macrophomina phaseolina TaxID=35725 RepID=A0ABQ8G7C8_9PEZI|nr:class I glutamine amidotransferase-like protein [Macrophomina phaseolina]
MASNPTTIRIGVLALPETQLLDVACVDVFGNASREYLDLLSAAMPPVAALARLAPSVSISYVSTVQPGEPIHATSSAKLLCSHHVSDPAVRPGTLDVVFVPGVDPTASFSSETTDWLAAHGAHERTDVLSVCTGIYLCGQAGLLKGRKVCGPRDLQQDLTQRFNGHGATFLGHELRWVQDGNFWSSGGITNGNDMVAAYLRQSEKWPKDIAELAIRSTDVGERPQRFSE